jgi:hypothetical protein
LLLLMMLLFFDVLACLASLIAFFDDFSLLAVVLFGTWNRILADAAVMLWHAGVVDVLGSFLSSRLEMKQKCEEGCEVSARRADADFHVKKEANRIPSLLSWP